MFDQSQSDTLNEIANRELAALFPASPNTRYWIGVNGHQYHYTTERADAGKFWALEYKPIGEGARTGKARQWQLIRRVGFVRRKAAKARAYQWCSKVGFKQSRH